MGLINYFHILMIKLLNITFGYTRDIFEGIYRDCAGPGSKSDSRAELWKGSHIINLVEFRCLKNHFAPSPSMFTIINYMY